jgi:ubiquinone/menaquinone biosynthesis C-methylase UbiE
MDVAVSMRKYRKPAELKGWDFSQVKVIEEGPIIDYSRVVESHLGRNKTLLDVGTGGGERLKAFAPKVREAIGIDIDRKMIKTAAENLRRSGSQNVNLILCDSEKMPVVEAHIDIVINRHAPFGAKEVSRILRLGGTFITQQVSEGDKRNFKEVFKRGQSYGEKRGTLKKRYLRELRESGIHVVKEQTVNTTEYYESIDDVIFLIANTPIIPNFNFEKEQEKLEEIEDKFKTLKGIKTNSERFLIVGTKDVEVSVS